MQRMIKTFFCAGLLIAASWQQARGFALLGPIPGTPAADLSVALPANFGDAWQVNVLGYDAPSFGGEVPGDVFSFGDLGGPKNIGEGYRRNDPVLYYASDGTGGSFAKFFGVQGEAAVDQAFAILNNFFTNRATGVDGYSPNLTEFPFDSQSFNGTAVGLYLTDLKSVTLHLLVEQMGLTEPERYTWTLENRYLPAGGKCPVSENYIVVQRNFSTTDLPLTGPETGTLYSPYVNNILYTYGISEVCTIPGGSFFQWLAVTEPFEVNNPGKTEFTAVAANDYDGLENLGPGGGLEDGGFYTGLTEDDAAGLRYLMTTNNIELEVPATGTELEFTNTAPGALNLLETSDVYSLFQFAQTNPPAVLQAAFPNLEIETVSNYFTIGSNPIVTATLSTPVGSPAGVQVLTVVTNGWTFFPITNFSYTFGNVIYVNFHTNTPVQIQLVQIGQEVGAPAGYLATNVTYTTVIQTNVPSGDYYIIPPGSCGFEIVSNIFPNHLQSIFTNVIAASTNSAGFVGTESIVTYFTNDWLEYFTCTFVTNSPGYYQGVEKLQFIRVSDKNVDPLTDVFFQPLTNTYSMVVWDPTNQQIGPQTFQRIVTAPDFLFKATPEASGPAGVPVVSTVERDIHFEDGQIVPGLSGPGVIDGETTFTYNDIGTVWWNGPFLDTNSYVAGDVSEVNQTTAIPSLLWASYDATTNAPYVYPNNESIQELESQMIIAISPTNLPDGTNGQPYVTTTFKATGGTPSYNWSLAPGSQLPNGLGLFGNTLEGVPNGNNTNAPYDVTIQLMDSSNPTNTILMNYTITIH